MKYSVSPVVRVAVTAKNAQDLPKLIEGLKKLNHSDPILQCNISETGEQILGCTGELHSEIVLNDLRGYCKGIEIIVSHPIVNYKETVTAKSAHQVLTKSANNHNRMYAVAEPLAEDLIKEIEKGDFEYFKTQKESAKKLVTEYGWDKDESMRIWAFGPEHTGANILVNCTKGLQYMDEVQDSMATSFQTFTQSGVLCGEALKGVRINLEDALLHTDSTHRRPNQMEPMARRLYSACQLVA